MITNTTWSILLMVGVVIITSSMGASSSDQPSFNGETRLSDHLGRHDYTRGDRFRTHRRSCRHGR